MENQSRLSVLTIDNLLRKGFAMKMMRVMILAIVLLASSLGRASAAGNDLPGITTDAPNCGSGPICGYIQAHSLDKLVMAAPDCGNQPICGYLQSHNIGR